MAEHNVLGKEGEGEAVAYLQEKGYVIRHRNWLAGRLELDIVAERYGELVMVEVKSRSSEVYGSPLDAVNEEKQRYLVKAADVYMRFYRLTMPVRFDVIAIVGQQPPYQITHVRDAFRPMLWNEHSEKI